MRTSTDMPTEPSRKALTRRFVAAHTDGGLPAVQTEVLAVEHELHDQIVNGSFDPKWTTVARLRIIDAVNAAVPNSDGVVFPRTVPPRADLDLRDDAVTIGSVDDIRNGVIPA